MDWSDAALLKRMEDGWGGGLPETRCGNGSLRHNIRNVVWWVPEVMDRLGLRSMCDAGAGDLHWEEDFGVRFSYRAFDLVPRRMGVMQWDVTKEALPGCDVILCRAVLIHLDPPRIHRALELFRKSATYLMATTEPSDNVFDPSRQCNPIDLEKPPFSLGPPLESVQDLEGKDSRLGLWRLR